MFDLNNAVRKIIIYCTAEMFAYFVQAARNRLLLYE